MARDKISFVKLRVKLSSPVRLCCERFPFKAAGAVATPTEAEEQTSINLSLSGNDQRPRLNDGNSADSPTDRAAQH